MAVTDQTTGSAVVPRVFTIDYDGRLFSKRTDDAVGGWTYHSCCGYNSGLDAVSWADGSNARQRVFAAKEDPPDEGDVEMRIYDDGSYGGVDVLPAGPSGAEFYDTDVAALTWDNDGEQCMAVASIATNERVCVWEGTFANGFNNSPVCSDTGYADGTNKDIDGTMANGLPWFGFQHDSGGLAQVRRTVTTTSCDSPTDWFFTDLGDPPGETGIDDSVAAWPSQAEPGKVEVAVAGASGDLYTARKDPGLGYVQTWTALPAMPGGESPAAQWSNFLSATPYTTFDLVNGSQSFTVLFVPGDDGSLYRLRTDDEGAWGTWLSGSEGTAARPPDESWLGNGAAVALGGINQTPILYGAGGVTAFFTIATTLQGFTEGGFRDHVRSDIFSDTETVAGNTGSGTEPAAESTVSTNVGLFGLATAIRRNSPPPWEVVLTESDGTSGTRLWSDDYVLPTADGWSGTDSTGNPIEASLSDPYGLIDDNNDYHHIVLEAAVELDGSGPSCSLVSTDDFRMIYRFNSTFDALRSQTDLGDDHGFLVDTGFPDHGTLSLTEDSGAVTAHVVYNDVPTSTLRHWYHNEAVGTSSGNGTNLTSGSPSLPSAPAGTFSDAGNTAYAWSGTSAPQWCQLDTFGGCVDSGFVGGTSLSPSSNAPLIRFPASGGSDPTATCGDYRCFDNEEPFDIVADPELAERVHAVYQGKDGDETSVYYTQHDGGSLNAWSSTVQVNERDGGDERHFIDPSVTPLADGAIVVTYSAANDPETGLIEQYVAVSTDNGATFEEHQITGASWDPADLSYHCSRELYFLGEYRDGTSVGKRGYNLLHASSGGNKILRGRWASGWSIVQ